MRRYSIIYSIEELVRKYDIDDGFKHVISNLIKRMDKSDVIEILSNHLMKLLYAHIYEYELEIDNGSNVRIGIEDSIKKCLEELFK